MHLVRSLECKFSLSNFIQKINPHIAHIGVGIAIIGITCSSVFKQEYDFNLNEGEIFKVNDMQKPNCCKLSTSIQILLMMMIFFFSWFAKHT